MIIVLLCCVPLFPLNSSLFYPFPSPTTTMKHHYETTSCFMTPLTPCRQAWLHERRCNCAKSTCLPCLSALTADRTEAPGSSFPLTAWNDIIASILGESGEQRDIGEFMKFFTTCWERAAGVVAQTDASAFYGHITFTVKRTFKRLADCGPNV